MAKFLHARAGITDFQAWLSVIYLSLFAAAWIIRLVTGRKDGLAGAVLLCGWATFCFLMGTIYL